MNPAQEEILKLAQQDVDEGKIPSPVGLIVLREWMNFIKARRNHYELKAQRGFLSDEEYAELSALRISIDKYGSV